MQFDDFEWDDDKNTENVRKHGIAFDDAKHVFDDPLAVLIEDVSIDYRETRQKAVGYVATKLIAVNYTERDDRVRIISARMASKYEHRIYHEG